YEGFKAKISIFMESVEFLGFVVSKDGIKTRLDKVKAIKEFKKPSSIYELRLLLATTGDREVNYATNERELLAIVWALDTLRHYLYGKNDIKTYTDHQPLTFAVSDKNPNSKIKRWKERIEESGARVLYKPGKENYVADALSRQNVHALQNEPESDAATVHSEESLTYVIEASDKPVNCFQNQIILEEATTSGHRILLLFGSKTRHLITFNSR
ncbi:hypothetical protein KR074_005839, partial [Drosophila pseudoananassae]